MRDLNAPKLPRQERLDRAALGKAIRATREASGVSANRLSLDIGLSADAISRIERGVNGCSIRTLAMIAKRLGVTADSLLGWAE